MAMRSESRRESRLNEQDRETIRPLFFGDYSLRISLLFSVGHHDTISQQNKTLPPPQIKPTLLTRTNRMKLSTATIVISTAAAAAISSVAAHVPTSKASKQASKMGSKPGKAAKASYLRANTYSMSVDTYSMSVDTSGMSIPTEPVHIPDPNPIMSIDQTPTEPVHIPAPNPFKDCGPCNRRLPAGCPDVADYCEITATFYPTRIDDPITLTCEVCTDEGCPTIAMADCSDLGRRELAEGNSADVFQWQVKL
eukprot:scaffold15840_cov142-Skeletonema_marinoi.AAC.10